MESEEQKSQEGVKTISNLDHYWWEVAKWNWSVTWQQIAGHEWRSAIVAGLSIIVAFGVQSNVQGLEAAISDLSQWALSLAVALLLIPVLFFWNLVRAPFELDKAIRSSARAALDRAAQAEQTLNTQPVPELDLAWLSGPRVISLDAPMRPFRLDECDFRIENGSGQNFYNIIVDSISLCTTLTFDKVLRLEPGTSAYLIPRLSGKKDNALELFFDSDDNRNTAMQRGYYKKEGWYGEGLGLCEWRLPMRAEYTVGNRTAELRLFFMYGEMSCDGHFEHNGAMWISRRTR